MAETYTVDDKDLLTRQLADAMSADNRYGFSLPRAQELAKQMIGFIRQYREPLPQWVEPGTLTEAARHNRALEEIGWAELMANATRSRGAFGGGTLSDTLKTAQERRSFLTGETLSNLVDIYNKMAYDRASQRWSNAMSAGGGVSEADKAPTPGESHEAFIATLQALARPLVIAELTARGVDIPDLVRKFVTGVRGQTPEEYLSAVEGELKAAQGPEQQSEIRSRYGYDILKALLNANTKARSVGMESLQDLLTLAETYGSQIR